MKVSRNTAADESDFSGETYYFCSPSCREAFELDPEKYLPTNKIFRP